jgi:matrixin
LLKRLLVLLGIVLLTISCCISKTPSQHKENLTKYVYIDSKFSPAETAYIIEALQEWDCSTKHIVRFLQVSNEKDATLLIKVAEGKDKLIQDADGRVNTNKDLIADDPSRDKYTKLSAVGLHIDNASQPLILIVSDRLDDPYETRSIMLHEIGHDLGLKHIRDTNSVMFINRSQGSDHLTKLDLDAFCSLHDCRDYKLTPCIKKSK